MSVVQEWHGLVHGDKWCDKDLEGGKGVPNKGFIQRLDVETDGPVVCCKTLRAMKALQVQMKEHVFSKAYMCLVHGRVENKTHYVKASFAEIGAEKNTQVMLKYNMENDPFYQWCEDGKWPKRSIRMAETFF